MAGVRPRGRSSPSLIDILSRHFSGLRKRFPESCISGQVDALDVGILRAMGVRPYERTPKPLDALQPARIARVTGSSVNTVKDRITA